MADTKLADLTALTAPSGDDLLYVVDDPAGTPADRKLALNNLFTRGTVTADSPIVNAAQTWNNAAVTFTSLKLNVTDTASASGSFLMDLQRSGSSQFAFRRYTSGPYIVLDGNRGWIGAKEVSSTNLLVFSGATGGTDSAALSANNFYVGTTIGIGFCAGAIASNATVDTLLTRRAAANLRLGAADAAAPVAQTLSVQSVVAGTTNTAGANLTITGSQGTGSAAGGSIVFQVAPAGSSGTAQNALVDALTIDSTRLATFAAGVNAGGSVYAAAGSGVFCKDRSGFLSPSDGVIRITNWATSDFNRLQFGGTTSSFPALKRSSTTLQARLADDSNFTNIQGKLTTETAYTAGAPTATGYLVLYDSNGTAYKVPAEAV